MNRLIIFVLLAINYLELQSQTVVIAKKTKDAIYLAADSRLTGKRYDPVKNKIEYVYLDICKILITPKLNFVCINQFSFINIQEAGKAGFSSSNFREATSKFRSSFAARLRDTLEKLRLTKNPMFFELIKDYGKPISQTIVFGIDADSLVLNQILFILSSNTNGSVKIIDTSFSLPLVFGGHTDEIQDSIRKANWSTNIAETMVRLIRRAEKFHPTEVGGPIDIIKFTRKGIVWIQKKKKC